MKSIIGRKDRVSINYRDLEGTFKHSHEYFRSAFEELENKGYAYREDKQKKKETSVKIIKEKFCHDVGEEYQKIILKEYQNEESHNAV